MTVFFATWLFFIAGIGIGCALMEWLWTSDTQSTASAGVGGLLFGLLIGWAPAGLVYGLAEWVVWS